MRKILLLVLTIIVLFGTMALAQQPQRRQERRGNRLQRPGFERMIFGIPEKDYNSLNLTNEQKNQVKVLQENYGKELQNLMKSMKPTENNKNNQFRPPMFSAEQQEKMRQAEKKLNADFKVLLTEEQKAIYDKAYQVQINKQKEQFNKQLEDMKKIITFTDDQTTQIQKLLDDYTGDQFTFNTEFAKILTDEQKATYQQYLQQQFQQRGQNFRRGQGKEFRGFQGQRPNKETEPTE